MLIYYSSWTITSAHNNRALEVLVQRYHSYAGLERFEISLAGVVVAATQFQNPSTEAGACDSCTERESGRYHMAFPRDLLVSEALDIS